MVSRAPGAARTPGTRNFSFVFLFFAVLGALLTGGQVSGHWDRGFLVPDQDAEAGVHFGHPQGIQVRALEIYVAG